MIFISIVLFNICLSFVSSYEYSDDLDALGDYDHEIWNIGANNLFIPYESVSYTTRRLITIPFRSKRHISKIKTVIQPENSDLIESIHLFRCVKSSETFSDSFHEKNVWFEDRVVTNHENERHNCWKLLAVWTAGDGVNKTILSLPKNMGIPISEDLVTEKYLLFEINYKYSDFLVEFADYSGFQVYVRKQNTEVDADIVAIGSVPDYRLFIPPKMNEWTVTANCYKECQQKHLFFDGLSLFDVIHFSRKNHLKQLSVEIIDTDNDFVGNNFDGLPTKTVLRSDGNQTDAGPIDLKLGESNQIRIKCTFSSLNQSKTILGGMSDNSAQCMAWIVYYPKIKDFDVCLSSFSLTTIMSITGVEQLEEKWSDENDFEIVIRPQQNFQDESLHDYLEKKIDWDYRRVNRGKYVAQFGKQTAQCNWKRSFFDQIMEI